MGDHARVIKRKDGEKLLALHHLTGKLLSDEDLECNHWYEGFPIWPQQSDDGLRGTITQWSELARNALASASRLYEKRMTTSSGDAMKQAFRKEKTIGDKIAAVTLLVQESPVHRLDELRTLISFAQKKGRRERAPAIEAIKDLLLNDLLPSNRRLIFFRNRHFRCPKGLLSKRHVIYAMYESELKSLYREFLRVLEETGNDTLAFFKQKAVKIIYELLTAKPENEKTLLTMLVNKLGDPDRKVSSSASYSLLQLIEKDHPQMRLVVVKEVEQLLIRPHITPRTRYYSVCFLNQIRFRDEDVDLARKFVRMYMDLFTICLEEERAAEQPPDKFKKIVKRMKRKNNRKGERKNELRVSTEAKETKLMGALLVGVNRAFPYTKPEHDDSSYQQYYNSLFHVAHAKALGPSTHALAFLFQISQRNSTQNDRFYRALYSRIYDVADSAEMTQAAFLNLVYKAMKADTSAKRVKAFMKRLLQASCQGTPGFAGACVMVISETFATGDKGILKSFVSLAEKDDQDEEFRDIDVNAYCPERDLNDAERSSQEEKRSAADYMNNSSSGAANQTEELHLPTRSFCPQDHDTSLRLENPGRYDPSKRDPQYAGAERSSLWEAVTLTSHYHPSLSFFARTICADMKPVSYGSDPLKDFSQIAFLDRFSYKKAKNRVAKSLYGKRSVRYRDGPLANSEEFQELVRAGNVPNDDIFLARFFSANPDRVQRRSFHESHGSDVDSEEEAFEKAMEVEMRRLGGEEGSGVKGMNDFGGDIDEEDEDEIRAFEKAFEIEMMESEDERDPVNQESSLMHGVRGKEENERSDEDSPQPEVSHVALEPSPLSHSPFAAAEDYAEAIEKVMGGTEGNRQNLPRMLGQKKRRKRVREFSKRNRSDSVTSCAGAADNGDDEEGQRVGVNGPAIPSTSRRPQKRRRAEPRKTSTPVQEKVHPVDRKSCHKRKR